jgi:elongation factor Ts
MAKVTPAMIKELRESTQAGMLDCKKALTAAEGDMQGAVEWLRKKGLSKASKVAGKVTAEGTVGLIVSDDFKTATITEVNCQTDFVSQNENFVAIVDDMVAFIHTEKPADMEELKTSTISGKSFDETMASAVQRVGENIQVRRFDSLSVNGSGVANGYVHSNGSIGVAVVAKTDSDATSEKLQTFMKDIAMHAAAMGPQWLLESDIPKENLEKEEEFAREDLKKEGKPEAMWDKIIPGKLKKYAKENTLANQMFVKDDKKTVAQALADAAKEIGGTAELTAFARFKVGEGIEVEVKDFADEVAEQLAAAKA